MGKSCNIPKHNNFVDHFTSSHPEVFLEKGVLEICSKFTGEHPCRNVILIKLQAILLKSNLGILQATLLKSHFRMGVLL